ncbi:MAG: T9SS type A sorting domain-containing protein [Saprospiraceae bacterium]|nr:T9SS type A sorting domain-containing protein [Saprospiraceae bacterium]
MKTSFWIYFFLLVFSSVDVCSQNKLQIQNPDRTWESITGSISYAEYIIRPGINFVDCDLYMTYECKANNFKNDVQYEVNHSFILPENILVTDSWLWVDSFIMKALILERNTAINIYEGIVDRRRDPSLLLKNSATNYNYKIYPIFNNNTRRVKLSFQIPVDVNLHDRSFSLPLTPVTSSDIKNPVVIKIVDEHNYDYTNESGEYLMLENDPKLGLIYKTNVTPDVSSYTIKLKNEQDIPKLSFVYDGDTNPTGGFYQISVQPSAAFEFSTYLEKNVLILVEHDSVNSNFKKAEVMSSVDLFIKENLQAGDSLQVVYNGNGIKKHYPNFIPFESLNNFPSVSHIRPGNFSNMPASLFETYENLKNRTNPVIIIISSAGNVSSPATAQSLKNELVNQYGELIKTFVLSYANGNAPQSWYANITYRGNDLLHSILTTNSKGLLMTLASNVFSKDLWLQHWKNFGTQFGFLTQKPFEIQYSLKPQNGLCYDNIEVRKNAGGWMQTGRFVGTPPFEMDAIIWLDNQVFTRKLNMTSLEEPSKPEWYKQIHQGQKILQMENLSLNPKRLDIIDLSLSHRVLSRFTAFLALEPNLQEPCADCTDESTTSTEDIASSVHWKVYPNPFFDKVKIELSGLSAEDQPKEITLVNTRGEVQVAEISFKRQGEIWMIDVEAGHLPAGVYFLKVRLGNRILTCKLVKI